MKGTSKFSSPEPVLVFAGQLTHGCFVGLFDTIHCQPPLRCPECGAEKRELQTKEFGEFMAHFRIGSVLRGSPVLTGIIKESLWCDACHKAGRSSQSPVYLVVWHSVLAGVEQDPAQAEARLRAVDRLDLIGWLDDAQREADRWRRRYYDLFSDLQRWHEYTARAAAPEPEVPGEETEKRRAFRRLFDPRPEIIEAPDPLLAVLEANSIKDTDEDRE